MLRPSLKRQPLFFVACVVSVGAIAFASCDRDSKPTTVSVNSNSAPATSPAIVQSAATPVTQPAVAIAKSPATTMLIDGQRIDFPAARLRVGRSDGSVIAVLHSDDPRDAINDKYAGNSFYFQMELDVPVAKDFADVDWSYKADTVEPAESPYGIFIDGHRKQLQPHDVKIVFEPTGPSQTMVTLSGEFLLVDVQDINAPSRVVQVIAEFTAQTVVKQ